MPRKQQRLGVRHQPKWNPLIEKRMEDLSCLRNCQATSTSLRVWSFMATPPASEGHRQVVLERQVGVVRGVGAAS